MFPRAHGSVSPIPCPISREINGGLCDVAHTRLAPALSTNSTVNPGRSEMIQSSNVNRLMRIQARPGSPVERRHYRYPENRWAQLDPDAIAPGIPPDGSADLVFHGGKTVPQMEFQNVFLGGKASWLASDIDS